MGERDCDPYHNHSSLQRERILLNYNTCIINITRFGKSNSNNFASEKHKSMFFTLTNDSEIKACSCFPLSLKLLSHPETRLGQIILYDLDAGLISYYIIVNRFFQ